MTQKIQAILPTLVFVAAFVAIGSVIGLTTNTPDTMAGWYAGLGKSSLTPPGWVFGVVWTILYALLGMSAARLWARRKDSAYRPAIRLFSAQMVLNWGWSFVFFTLHQITLAVIWIAAILVLVILCLRSLCPRDRTTAILMLPYVLWLVFATYLSATIWWLN